MALADDVARWFSRLTDWMRSLNAPATRVGRPPVTFAVGPGAAPILVGPADRIAVGPGEMNVAESFGPLLVGPAEVLEIEAPVRPAWDDRGWFEKRMGNSYAYEGNYQVRRHGQLRRFPGRILVKNGAVTAYIANPPAEIRRHPKGPCFQLSSAPWFRVHWYRAANNVDDALLYIEKVLNEALM